MKRIESGKIIDLTKTRQRKLILERKNYKTALPNLVLNEKNSINLSKQKMVKNQQIKNENLQRQRKIKSIIPLLMKTSQESEKQFSQTYVIRKDSLQINRQSRKTEEVKQGKEQKRVYSHYHTDENKENRKMYLQQLKIVKQSHSLARFHSQAPFYLNNHKPTLYNIEKTLPKSTQAAVILIDQGVQCQQFQQKEGNAIQKTYTSIGVCTDLEINNSTYKQFIKFKVTQKQKYGKMQQIFSFINEISQKQLQAFKERYKKVQELYDEKPVTDRQKNVEYFLKDQNNHFNLFTKLAKSFMNSQVHCQNKFFNETAALIYKSLEGLSSFAKKEPQYLLQDRHAGNKVIIDNETLKQDSLTGVGDNEYDFFQQKIDYLGKGRQNQSNGTMFSGLTNLINKLLFDLKDNYRLLKQNIQQQMTESFVQIYKSLKVCAQDYENRNYLIRTCIDDIVRLPEMSLSIFGMSKEDQQSKKQGQLLRSIGVFLQEIPQFSYFGSKNKSVSQIDQAFQESMNFKCLNCVYLKSKMRFIYKKNEQLGPVLKILHKLMQNIEPIKL